jgi:transposase
MVESTRAAEVEQAMEKFGDSLHQIKNISMDMSSTYALVFNDLVPRATQVIDKFHVMKYAYEAVLQCQKQDSKRIAATTHNGKKTNGRRQQTVVGN